jgi:GDP-L-fucose synthase
MHVDDAADAVVMLLRSYSGETHVNVGVGEDIAIGDLARMIASVTGFDGEIVHDRTKPDGTPRKVMDVSKLRALGWEPRYDLRSGLEQTYGWFREHVLTGDVRLNVA